MSRFVRNNIHVVRSAVMFAAASLMLPSCSQPHANNVENSSPAPNEEQIPTFGKNAWEHYWGNVEEEPPRPDHIKDLLEGPCPFHPGKRVKDTTPTSHDSQNSQLRSVHARTTEFASK